MTNQIGYSLDDITKIFDHLEQGRLSHVKKVLRVKTIKEVFDNCRDSLIWTENSHDPQALKKLLEKAKSLQTKELSSANSMLTERSFFSFFFGNADKVQKTREHLKHLVGYLKGKVDRLDLEERIHNTPLEPIKNSFIKKLDDLFEGIDQSDVDALPKKVRELFKDSTPLEHTFYALLKNETFKKMVENLDKTLRECSSEEDKFKIIYDFLPTIPPQFIGLKSEDDIVGPDERQSIMVIILLLSSEIKPSLLKQDKKKYPIICLIEGAFHFLYKKKNKKLKNKLTEINELYQRLVNESQTKRLSKTTKKDLFHKSIFSDMEKHINKLPPEKVNAAALEALSMHLEKLEGKEKILYPMPWFFGKNAVGEKRVIFQNILETTREAVTAKLAHIKFEEQRKIKAEAQRKAAEEDRKLKAEQKPAAATVQHQRLISRFFSWIIPNFLRV